MTENKKPQSTRKAIDVVTAGEIVVVVGEIVVVAGEIVVVDDVALFWSVHPTMIRTAPSSLSALPYTPKKHSTLPANSFPIMSELFAGQPSGS